MSSQMAAFIGVIATLTFIALLAAFTHEEDKYQYQCMDGHVYYKSSKDQGFWYKTGTECK